MTCGRTATAATTATTGASRVRPRTWWPAPWWRRSRSTAGPEWSRRSSWAEAAVLGKQPEGDLDGGTAGRGDHRRADPDRTVQQPPSGEHRQLDGAAGP